MNDFVRSHSHLAQEFGLTYDPPVLTGIGDDIAMPPFPAAPRPQDHYLEPQKVRAGQAARSTSLELAAWPSVVWDVNGYYHCLGVGWAASRKQLMQGYLAADGQSDDYLTYVLSQLLNPRVRREYDACPQGTKYFDRYVEAEIKRRAAAMAEVYGTSAETVLNNWGFEFVRDDEEVDIPQEDGEDRRSSTPAPESASWPYGYYLWRLRRADEVLVTVEAMQCWQEAIAAECQRRKVVLSFGVGAMGPRAGSVAQVMSVDGVTVVFAPLHRLHEIEVLAPHAVNRLLSSQARPGTGK